MTNLTRNQLFAIAVSAAASLLALYLMFRGIDFDEFSQQIKDARLEYVVAVVLVYPLGMLLRVVRWPLLLEKPLPFWRSFHIINIAYLFNAVLPFRLGEVVRILLNTREPEQTAGASISAATIERLFDLMMALICVGLGLAVVETEESLPSSVTTTITTFIAFTVIGMVVLLFLPRSHPLILGIARTVLSIVPERLSKPLLTFLEDTLRTLRVVATPRRMALVFASSIVTWLAYVLYFYVGLFAFFNDVPVGVAFLIVGFVAVGAAAPSLPGAIGVFQAAAVLALRTAGYDTEAATGYAWVVWFSQTIPVILFGILGLSALSLSFGRLTQDVLEEAEKEKSEEQKIIPEPQG
jgi:glycosyltransferase 2 family protein